jgi:hypothetical protein
LIDNSNYDPNDPTILLAAAAKGQAEADDETLEVNVDAEDNLPGRI